MADASLAHERQVLRDCVEQAVYAEAMDFDRVWAVEHHCLRWYAHMSAPEVFELSVEDGHSIVLVDPVPPELQDAAQLGVDSCPERAISAE